MPDNVLLSRFQNGDRQAFETIYSRYAYGLVDYAAGKLASLDEARDVVHDLFVELWTRREKVMVSSSLRAYLFTAARYRIIDHIRKNIRKEYYASLTLSLGTDTDYATQDAILHKDLNQQIEAEINNLPPRTREIFRLSRQQHMSVQEIARELQLSDQTVKNQLTTALRKLRIAFNKLAGMILLWFF